MHYFLTTINAKMVPKHVIISFFIFLSTFFTVYKNSRFIIFETHHIYIYIYIYNETIPITGSGNPYVFPMTYEHHLHVKV
jgi:hypothetical protein